MFESPKILGSWLLILCYMGVVLYFVIRGARKTQSMADYAIGNMGFSPISVALALAASITSAATFIINPGFVALYGWSAVISYAFVLPLGALISLIIFTKGFRSFGTSIKALTMAQWIGKRYGSKAFALFFAVLSLLLLTFIVLICVGITKVLSISLDTNQVYTLAGVIIFIFGYMTFGGANSMVYTNTIQAVIMIVVSIILLSSGYEHFSEGVHGFWDKLSNIDPKLSTYTNSSSPLFRDYFEIIFCQFVIGIAVICQPHIITKSLLLKSEKDVNTYLVWGIIVEALFFLVVIVGLYARLEFPDLTFQGKKLAMDGIVSAYVISEFPVILTLIIILGLISAGISTLEGLIQSLSTTITSDIIESQFGKQLFAGENGERKKIQVNRMVIAVLAILAFVFSYQQLLNPNLSVALFAQNGVYAYFSAAFVPVLFGTFFPRTPLIAPVAASITAVMVHFAIYYGRLGTYMQEEVRNPAIAATIAILAAIGVGFLFYFLFKNKQQKPELQAEQD
ncbi:MAG: sodium:solute symporter [Bacteroidia bacterium]|nr:sodium:solute symporter [Bacteroidia bacterium]